MVWKLPFKKKKINKKKVVTFLVVGRNHPKKNYRKIVSAAKNLSFQKIKNFKIIFIGKDVLKLKDEINYFNLQSNIKLIEQIGSNKNKKKM